MPRMAIALGLGVALVVLGCAAPVAGPHAELSMGTDDDGDPAVVALVFADDPTVLKCTGTVVGERVVLTAAHCASDIPVENLLVFFGPDLRRPGTLVPVQAALVHLGADGTADADLAMLLLAEPAPVAPVSLVADAILADPPPVGVRLVGYGLTAAGAGDAVRKREGRSRTTEVNPQHVVLGPDPSLPCIGDSGGPVYVTTPMGERLAGVVSRGDAACTDRARATRLDVHLDAFIRPTLEAWAPGSLEAGAPCLYDAHCARGVCAEALDEPSLRFCASACTTDVECGASLSCQEALCRYPLPSPGAIGSTCVTHEDCVRGDCLTDQGSVCSVRCVSGRGDCPTNFACEHLGGIDFYCLPEPEPTCGACAVGPARPGAGWMLAALVALALRKRARRPLSRTPRSSS
ncbi:MAG: trypsin-like serine protease [Sandaracinaceae bacterium]|nr:trypsin-like serine protease [Sandaracinaceae bacterium]